MKNLVILGLASLLLFGVAAGLSVWLQQSKTPVAEEKDKEKDKEKKGVKDEKDKPKEEKPKEKIEPVKPKDDGPLVIGAEQKATAEELKRRELRMEKQKAQQLIVLEDISALRQEVDQLGKKRDLEVKIDAARSDDPSAAQPDPAPKKGGPGPAFADRPLTPAPPSLPDPVEKKNFERLAIIYESMPPEAAAKLIQEQADGGKMDAAVKVLIHMRERASGKVIAEIADRTLAAQIIDRMLQYNKKPVLPGISP